MSSLPLILPYRNVMPKIDSSAWVAPGTIVIGDVEIGPETSIWPGCVLRGDIHEIRIGARTNLQDGTIVHVTEGGCGVHIGDEVTIGHMALIHDCTIESNAFVGMRAAVMDGAKVESHGVLAAGALLTPSKTVLSGQIWAGNPAKFMRELRDSDRAEFGLRWQEYVELMRTYR